MRFRVFPLFLLFLLTPGYVVSCDCRAAPVCAYVAEADAAFIGKVTFTNHDESLGMTQRTLVHFQVEEIFKGLAPGTSDVWIDPGSFTSCYRHYPLGERFLVFGRAGSTLRSLMPSNSVAMSVVPKGAVVEKPVPPGIDPANPPVVYYAPTCSGSSNAITPERQAVFTPEIEYLRKYRDGSTVPMIEGRVYSPSQYESMDPVKITLTGRGLGRTTYTDSQGRFSFEGLSSGTYSVTASLASYLAIPRGQRTTISPTTCGYIQFRMAGSAVIEGQVLDHLGRPRPIVEISLRRFKRDGSPEFGDSTKYSDENGSFRFERLLGGEYEIGINLSGSASVGTPYPTTKWNQDGRSSFHLNPGENKKVGPIQLLAPAKIRTIDVEVRWPDGRPAAGALVYYLPNGFDHGGTADARGRTQVDLVEGYSYQVFASMLQRGSRTETAAGSRTIEVQPGSEPSLVELTLNPISAK